MGRSPIKKIVMNSYLDQKLHDSVKSNDILMADYKDLNEDLGLEGLNFQKVRGSVRLLMRRVFTPRDVKALKKKVLSLNFKK